MKTITIRNPNKKTSFVKMAEYATCLSKSNRALVRFTMGPASHRQTFVASPNKPVATLVWEWSKSAGGLSVKKAQRRVAKRIVETGTIPV